MAGVTHGRSPGTRGLSARSTPACVEQLAQVGVLTLVGQEAHLGSGTRGLDIPEIRRPSRMDRVLNAAPTTPASPDAHRTDSQQRRLVNVYELDLLAPGAEPRSITAVTWVHASPVLHEARAKTNPTLEVAQAPVALSRRHALFLTDQQECAIAGSAHLSPPA